MTSRLEVGVAHERAVAERLQAFGWSVQPWGQALLNKTTRDAMRHVTGATIEWRWLPDFVVWRGDKMFLVDPKTEKRTDTPNFSIELSAHRTHLAMRMHGLEIVYVWADFSCNRCADLEVIAEISDASRSRGSGTPFALVRKTDQLLLETVFG